MSNQNIISDELIEETLEDVKAIIARLSDLQDMTIGVTEDTTTITIKIESKYDDAVFCYNIKKFTQNAYKKNIDILEKVTTNASVEDNINFAKKLTRAYVSTKVLLFALNLREIFAEDSKEAFIEDLMLLTAAGDAPMPILYRLNHDAFLSQIIDKLKQHYETANSTEKKRQEDNIKTLKDFRNYLMLCDLAPTYERLTKEVEKAKLHAQAIKDNPNWQQMIQSGYPNIPPDLIERLIDIDPNTPPDIAERLSNLDSEECKTSGIALRWAAHECGIDSRKSLRTLFRQLEKSQLLQPTENGDNE